mgnify:CR=1 FL=1
MLEGFRTARGIVRSLRIYYGHRGRAAAMDRLEINPEDLQALVEAGTQHFLKGASYYRVAINELEEARRLFVG